MVVALAVQLLNHVQFFSIPWTAALEAPLSFTISWSLLKLMSIELVMPSNHLIFCLPLLLLLSILLASEKRGDSLAFWTFFFFWHFHCQGRVCSLVRKLRSHKPPRAPPTNKKKKKKKVHFVCLRRHGATCVRARTEGTEALSVDLLRSPV